jgi:hypothetical protein
MLSVSIGALSGISSDLSLASESNISWQAYLLGRPITIALHHFDAQLPSFSEPAFPAAGRSYLGNLELLRLSGVIGPILDDAASLQPVPYASIQRNERALLQ